MSVRGLKAKPRRLRYIAEIPDFGTTSNAGITKDRVIPRVLPGNTGLDFHYRVFDLGYTA